jgi:hypothetical protein
LLKGFAGVLPGEPKNVKLRKEKDRGEKRFKIFADFTGASDNILSTFSLKMFWVSRSPKSLIFFNNRRRYLRRRRVLVSLSVI